MAQKYTIFINEKPLYLTNKIDDQGELNFYFLEKTDIIGLIKKYFTNKISECYLFHPDESQLIKIFKRKLDVEKAGGGIAYNQNGKILFIHRNGKWDLPKGGLNKNENYEAAALREVEEETGAKKLRIIQKLQKTYHVFLRNDKYKLKVTQWYKMTTDYNEELHPQIEEGIKKVKWVKQKKINKKLKNSYQNIRLLFDGTTHKITRIENQQQSTKQIIDKSIKEILWNQLGASIDMLTNVISQSPDDYFITHKRFYYIAFHSAIFLDYYLTNPPSGFSPLLSLTQKEAKDRPLEAIDNLIPDKIYSKQEMLEYLDNSREKCKQIINTLTDENLNQRFKEGNEPNDMDYPIFEILLYNLRHTQHHVAQLNMLLRQDIGKHIEWLFRADDIVKNK